MYTIGPLFLSAVPKPKHRHRRNVMSYCFKSLLKLFSLFWLFSLLCLNFFQLKFLNDKNMNIFLIESCCYRISVYTRIQTVVTLCRTVSQLMLDGMGCFFIPSWSIPGFHLGMNLSQAHSAATPFIRFSVIHIITLR